LIPSSFNLFIPGEVPAMRGRSFVVVLVFARDTLRASTSERQSRIMVMARYGMAKSHAPSLFRAGGRFLRTAGTIPFKTCRA